MAFISDEERKRILAQMLSGQLMRPPPPMQATPATPLPGVPVQTAIVAPQSEQAVAPPPQNDEFALARQMIQGRQGPALTGNKEIDAILTANAERRQAGAQNYLNMLAGADIDPVLKEILAERRAKVQKETAELEVEQKKAGWDALMRAGLAMAQSNSPYFMQALASGMEAGVKGYDEAKVRREEKRARLQTADEDARIAEVTGKQAAQTRAANAFNAAMAAGLNEEQAQAAARRAVVEELTLPQQLEMARLEPEAKRADIAYTKARTVDALRPPSSGGGRGGGREPNPPSATSVLEEGGKFTREIPELREAARSSFYAYQKEKDPTKKAELKGKYEIARDNYRRVRDRLAKIEGRQPGSPFRRSVTGEIYTGPQRTATGPRPAAASARPAGVGADWTYEKDAKGNKAWVSPDRKRVVEVK